ncbi:hypothetical protein PF005_g25832 [Phytophthora fragariae]|uniref:DDE Tnp4 domain-containing protein n=1 Tax=Phytophthora fragariae TaxID=53985 RepID=A0A6A3W1I3_9STRA|nr:hypothetical protein PF011_g24049 [Phytophthora fragariae]KAE9067450.1 hypothetical protein PF010_g27454 [Phytophthora fragariae]KAE9174489.1 hypothetical protein PF005_g25832 [Phytophthora fragariae]
MRLTQHEAIELLLVLFALNEEATWMALQQAGLLNSPERPLIPDVRFDLSTYGDASATKDFRFDVNGIKLLANLFALPGVVITEVGDRCIREEALTVMLYRLSYPRRLHDMMGKFGRSTSALSRIFLRMNQRYEDTMYFNLKLVQARIHDYCSAIERKSSAQGIFAFPDGTKIPICRPSPRRGHRSENLQRQVYSGHKRVHCLLFQGLSTPDGLCIHFFGPYEGRRHDTTLFSGSGILRYFDKHSIFEGKTIFGDPAYSVSKYVVTRFKSVVQTTYERIFNKEMSAVRTAVEWNFGIMKRVWAFIDFKKNLKLRLSPVGKFVRVVMLLTNRQCCYFGGNQISTYFNLPPPTLRDYLERD